MNLNHLKYSWLLPSIVASFAIPSAYAQQASNVEWTGENATGNWSDTTWFDVDTDTVRSPADGDLVGFLGDAANITVDVDTPLLEQLLIDDFYTLEIDNLVEVSGTNGVNNPDPDPDVPPTGFFVLDGTLNVNGTGLISVIEGGVFELGRTGFGELNLVDGGEINLEVESNFGRDAPGDVTVNQTGGTILHTGGIARMAGWSSSMVWNLSGGLTEFTSLRIGWGSGTGTGVVNHTGGEMVLKSNNCTIGWDSSGDSTFTYNLSDTGKLTVPDDRLRIGVSTADATSNFLIQTGGELFVQGRLDIGESGDENTSTNLYSISGGMADIRNVIFVGAFGSTGTGELQVSGDAMVLANGILVGNGFAGTANVSGGMVQLFGRLRIGSNNGSTGTNEFNLTGGTVEVNNRVDIGERPTQTNILNVSGGNLSLIGEDKRMLVGFFNDGTGIFNLSGTGVVDAEQVVLGDNAGAETIEGTVGTVHLTGGTLITRTIRVGGGDPADQTLVLDGANIQFKADLVDPADLIAGNVTTTSLLAGGVTFDTAGGDASTTGVMTGPGGLTKAGVGTLTVNSVQAYTGDTRVDEGTLILVEPYLADTADVYLASGTTLELLHETTDNVRSLYVDGSPVAPGLYDSTADFISGTGSLNVLEAGSGPEGNLEITSITVDGAIATIVVQGEASTEYVCKSSTSLSGFDTIATTPSPIVTDGSGVATFTVAASEARRFYVVEESSAQ
ncbi:hypothetical protein [Haloferula sp.]|uniref:hypothetical protein n=1 Tax=Haloferula sp. TaxID=2497595 RepID=UPI003C759E1D